MKKTVDFDYVLDHIGGGGRFQILAFIAISFHGIISGLMTLQAVFISYSPEFRCKVPPLDNKTLFPNLIESEILNYTTPIVNERYDRCSRYNYNLSFCDANLTCVNRSALPTSCDHGYHFSNDEVVEITTVTEFELICDREIYFTVESSTFMLGAFVGGLSLGYVSDRIGRRPTLICTALLTSVLNGVVIMSRSYIVFAICRFAYNVFNAGTYIVAFVYILEIAGRKYRAIFGVGFQITYALGYMLWSGIAYEWKNWRHMQIATVLITIPSLLAAFVLPESPCWLFAKRRVIQGKKVTKCMARINGKAKLLTEDFWIAAEKMKDFTQEGQLVNNEALSYFTIFKAKRMRYISFNMLFIWITCGLVYNGISLNSGELPGNLLVNNLIAGVCESAIYLIGIYTLDRFGRRKYLSADLLITGVTLITSTFLIEFSNTKAIRTCGIILAIIGRVSISSAFAITYNFTAELYSTDVRGNASGILALGSSAGSILYPYVLALHKHVAWLPGTIMGVITIAAGFTTLLFPETTDQPMLETVSQAEAFYRQNPPYKRIYRRGELIRNENHNRKDEEEKMTNVEYK